MEILCAVLGVLFCLAVLFCLELWKLAKQLKHELEIERKNYNTLYCAYAESAHLGDYVDC